MNDDKQLFVVTKSGTHSFKSGYDLWIWAMLNRPDWFLSEKLTDRAEVSSIVGQYAKGRK